MGLLEACKKHLNIDPDIQDDDAYINSLIVAAEIYLKNAGVPEGDCPLRRLCLQILVADWYERRESIIVGATALRPKEISRHVSDIILQLKL